MPEFKVVDVFSRVPFQGNPVAVVLDADGLTDAQMQQIAAWTNLSETTFHLPPTEAQADYRLRIFTPRSELPFAGHPTLGSAHALIEAGRVPAGRQLVQQCEIGLVPVSVDADTGSLSFRLPEPGFTDLTAEQTRRVEQVIGARLKPGCRPALVDVGARWVVAEMADDNALLGLTPDFVASARFENELRATGLSLFGRRDDPAGGIEIRSFAPSCGVNEDPVCGSGNGAVAAYRLRSGDIKVNDSYLACQGRCVNREGRIRLRLVDGQVHVGGAAVTTVSGNIALPAG